MEIVNRNSQDQNKDSEVEPRRSKRARIEKSFGPDFLTYILKGEPQTHKEAVNSTNGVMWKKAIRSEIDAILQNHILQEIWLLEAKFFCCQIFIVVAKMFWQRKFFFYVRRLILVAKCFNNK